MLVEELKTNFGNLDPPKIEFWTYLGYIKKNY